jgi:hypothetical protein
MPQQHADAEQSFGRMKQGGGEVLVLSVILSESRSGNADPLAAPLTRVRKSIPSSNIISISASYKNST